MSMLYLYHLVTIVAHKTILTLHHILPSKKEYGHNSKRHSRYCVARLHLVVAYSLHLYVPALRVGLIERTRKVNLASRISGHGS
jgi:hypothetical protein